MRTRTVMMVIAIGAVLASGAFAGDEILGRDVARGGELRTVSGSLLYDRNEWFIDASSGTFELHMGPLGHDEGLPFVDGSAAVVRGFALGEHIAPIWVATGDETYEFWFEQRFPRWAGEGARRNADEADRDDYGARRLAMDDPAPASSSGFAGGFDRDGFEPAYRNQTQRPGRGR
ncbi:MAG: hypothetical protein EA382_18410 [Spirochaetaceae bacterium]|nr:MAG: hypothetical protein EA382_18410 [Spirochaetaceae bacterium]